MPGRLKRGQQVYAVIRAGGKQHKVAKGDIIEIERLKGDSDSVEFTPLLVVDDKGKVRSGKSDLAKARVTATILGESKGTKIDVYKFRNKTGYRRHTGHRQTYSRIEISGIKLTADAAKKESNAGTAKKESNKEEANDGA
jgi:large subunit ribosomal protein L21